MKTKKSQKSNLRKTNFLGLTNAQDDSLVRLYNNNNNNNNNSKSEKKLFCSERGLEEDFVQRNVFVCQLVYDYNLLVVFISSEKTFFYFESFDREKHSRANRIANWTELLRFSSLRERLDLILVCQYKSFSVNLGETVRKNCVLNKTRFCHLLIYSSHLLIFYGKNDCIYYSFYVLRRFFVLRKPIFVKMIIFFRWTSLSRSRADTFLSVVHTNTTSLLLLLFLLLWRQLYKNWINFVDL